MKQHLRCANSFRRSRNASAYCCSQSITIIMIIVNKARRNNRTGTAFSVCLADPPATTQLVGPESVRIQTGLLRARCDDSRAGRRNDRNNIVPARWS
jgi:hypothetical protein